MPAPARRSAAQQIHASDREPKHAHHPRGRLRNGSQGDDLPITVKQIDFRGAGEPGERKTGQVRVLV